MKNIITLSSAKFAHCMFLTRASNLALPSKKVFAIKRNFRFHAWVSSQSHQGFFHHNAVFIFVFLGIIGPVTCFKIEFGLSRCSLRKQDYSNVLKILPPNNENFQINILIFLYFC